MRRRLTSLGLLAFLGLGTMAFAQVTGVVNDANNFPESDVEVTVKGTDKVTYTDENGNFNIDAKVGDTLVINGKEFKVTSNNLGALRYSTTENVDLGEVVVTGYGQVNRETFVGTASEVKGDVLNRKNVSNVSQALAGEVAGVRVINTSGQPGSDATIRVRGFGSVNGNRNPLYVLDGVPYDGTLSSINPEDIENLTVLKDATATAIYGARGTNGVIVITTKKGKKDSSEIVLEQKTGVNVSFLPRYDVIKSPEQYTELAWQSMYNYAKYGGAGAAGQADPTAYANANLFGGNGISTAYNPWNADGKDLIDPATGKFRNGVSRKYNPENWEDYGFQTSIRNETNLSISGGSGKTQYYTSFGYLNDEGYLINSKFERYSTRLGVTHQAKDWLTGSLNIGYAHSKSKNNGQSADSGSIFWFVDNIPSIYPLFLRDANGNIVEDTRYGGPRYDYGDEHAAGGRGFGLGTNAIADALYGKDVSLRHEMNANAYLKADILPYLSFETRLGGNFNTRSRAQVDSKYYGPSATADTQGSITKYDYDTFNYTFLQMLKFDKRFGKHNVSAFIAHESTDYRYEIFYASKKNMILDGSTDLNAATDVISAQSYRLEWGLESYFANLAYDFDGKYLFTANVRRDGSSRFINKDQQWGTFGSVGAGWVISRENFLKDSRAVKLLKLKASYGVVGDQGGVGYYPGYGKYQAFPLNGEQATYFDNIGYPDLTWEKSKIFQTGIEFAFLKNSMISGSVDFYSKTTDNLIFDRRTPISLGYAIMKVNGGKLLNQGIEFTLNTDFIKTKDAFLSLSINGEILKNEITEMPYDPITGTNKLIDVQGSFGWAKGKSIYDYYMADWAGVNQANGRGQWVQYFVDNDGDGVFGAGDTNIRNLHDFQSKNPDANITKGVTENYANASLAYVGKSAIPDIRGGFTLNAGYKGFSLSTQFLYSIGGYAYDGAYASLMSNRNIGSNNWHKDMLNSWNDASYNQNTTSDVPRLSNGMIISGQNDTQFTSVSSRFLTKSDYLALNNVKFGYEFTKEMLSRTGLAGLNLFVSGDNLWITTKRKGFNPSTSENGGSDTYRYSPLTTFTFGVRAKF